MITSVSSGVTGVLWPLDEYVRQVGCCKKEGGWVRESGEKVAERCQHALQECLAMVNTLEVIIINLPLELMLWKRDIFPKLDSKTCFLLGQR